MECPHLTIAESKISAKTETIAKKSKKIQPTRVYLFPFVIFDGGIEHDHDPVFSVGDICSRKRVMSKSIRLSKCPSGAGEGTRTGDLIREDGVEDFLFKCQPDADTGGWGQDGRTRSSFCSSLPMMCASHLRVWRAGGPSLCAAGEWRGRLRPCAREPLQALTPDSRRAKAPASRHPHAIRGWFVLLLIISRCPERSAVVL